MDNAIEARGLVKTYRGDVQALKGVSLATETGSVFGLLGPNGAGKSTAVKILTTHSRPDAGEAFVAGHDVLRHPARVRLAIGCVAQKSGLDLQMRTNETDIHNAETAVANAQAALTGATNSARDFRILTSLDDLTYQVAVEGTLPVDGQAQLFDFPAATCRYVKLELTSGYSSNSMELAEFSIFGTPTNDADADLMVDSWEMDYFGTYSRTGADDFDGDTLTDLQEAQYGGNPRLKDTDGDGANDREELIAGTAMGDAGSVFAIASAAAAEQPGPGQLAIRWNSVTGKLYKVQGNTNLCGPWPTSALMEVLGDGTEKAYTNSTTESPLKTFRITVE